MVKKPHKKSKQQTSKPRISPRTRMLILPIFVVIGAGAVILTILGLIAMPKANQGSQRGIGADGFHAYIEEGGDLGVKSLVSKTQVATVLDGKAKSVGDESVSKVFNLNDNRGQTVTFPFVRSDGVDASVYIDVRLYKNTQALEDDHIYAATANAGKVQSHPAYYKHAQTISGNREYNLMVVNGLKAYRFVMTQPVENVTISEVAAVAVLKKLALEAKL